MITLQLMLNKTVCLVDVSDDILYPAHGNIPYSKNVGGKKTLVNKDRRKFGEKNFDKFMSMHVQFDTFLTLLINSPTHRTAIAC